MRRVTHVHKAPIASESRSSSTLYLSEPILKKRCRTPGGAICGTAFALAALLSLSVEQPADMTARLATALHLPVLLQDTEKAREKSSSPILAELDGTRAGPRPRARAQDL